VFPPTLVPQRPDMEYVLIESKTGQPHTLVSQLVCPTGGAWALMADGSVLAFGGAPYLGSVNSQDYWGDRMAAQMLPWRDRVRSARFGYQIVATSGEVYGQGGEFSTEPA
jgi:hypothetical protein